MNIANVTSRFAMISDMQGKELYKWRPLIEDSCRYISSRLKKDNLDENDTKRLEMLCAVYAARLCAICGEEGITSFTAGDVRVSPANSTQKYEKLWNEYAEKSQDLIKSEKFLFGRVV